MSNKACPPVFHTTPKSQTVKEGQTARFDCTVLGYPKFWSSWDKNGVIAIPSNKVQITETTNHACLEINSVTEDDVGIYRITVQNEMGRSEASAWLEIAETKTKHTDFDRPYLTVRRKFMGHSVFLGDRLLLFGQYRTQKIPIVSIYHDNVEIVESDRVHIYISKQSVFVVIDSATFSDSGKYLCLIHCSNDQIISMSTIVTINTREDNIQEDVPRIIEPLEKSIRILEGCPIHLYIKIQCFVPYTYVWMFNEQILYDCDEYRYNDYGNGVISLVINDPFIYDSGVYTCIVSSAKGQRSSTCLVKVLEAECIPSFMVPQITVNPASFYAVEGSSVSLRASVTPVNCEVQWRIRGLVVDSSMNGVSIIKCFDGEQTLHIDKVNIDISGEILCFTNLPDNPSVTSSNSIILTVLPSKNETKKKILPNVYPHFLNKLPDCTVLKGKSLTLDVSFQGNPIPHIMWMRAGRSLEDENITIMNKPGYSILHIDNISADQSGKYTAAITNTFGSDTISTSVSVEGPPDPPSSQPSVTARNDYATIEWSGPPYDGGSAISCFMLEMQCDDCDWTLAAIVYDALSYIIYNLESGKRFRFRIRAKNIHGYSQPSLPSKEICLSPLHKYDEDHSGIVEYGDNFKQRYEIQEELGRGRFGTVYRVQNKKSGMVFAAKIIKCIKSSDKHKIRDEISIMNYLQHPKLLKLIESFEAARESIMVTEYISGGELFERVVADDFTLTEKDCVIFLRQICEGVRYMHHSAVVHLDLKPENIMCNTRDSHQIKIIDFGLAQRLSRDNSVRVLLGTPEFVPPEIINYEPIGLQSDMWSVGVICYVLLSGLSPFMGENDVDTFTNITRAEYDFDDDAFDTVSEEAKDFIAGLLVYRKEDRFTAEQCLQTKWLALDSDILEKSKICTHKLKKFIIRRKWQKTGNAIRALGRMALLSASRRNSSVSSTIKRN